MSAEDTIGLGVEGTGPVEVTLIVVPATVVVPVLPRSVSVTSIVIGPARSVGVGAQDVVAVRAAGLDRARRRGCIAPVDRGGEVGGSVPEVGLGEGGHDDIRQRLPCGAR